MYCKVHAANKHIINYSSCYGARKKNSLMIQIIFKTRFGKRREKMTEQQTKVKNSREG